MGTVDARVSIFQRHVVRVADKLDHHATPVVQILLRSLQLLQEFGGDLHVPLVIAQRLDQFEGHIRGQAAHVMMGFDLVGLVPVRRG